MYWDAHCHLTRVENAQDVILQCQQKGLNGFVQGGIDHREWVLQQSLPRSCVRVFGIHPWTIIAMSESEIERQWRELLYMQCEAAGIGECGLDYVSDEGRQTKERQKKWFEKHLELAVEERKPIVCHVVRAHADALEILGRHHVHGMVHGFAGSLETAEAYLDLGLFLSIGPGLLRPGFKKLKKAIPYLPLERLVLESDAPDQGPGTGVSNQPSSVLSIAKEVARIHGKSPEEVLRTATQNLKVLFGEIHEST